MWHQGDLKIEGKPAAYCIKYFDKPSEEYGIDGGKISKLSIRMDMKLAASYDRGWIIEPETSAVKSAYKAILKKFN